MIRMSNVDVNVIFSLSRSTAAARAECKYETATTRSRASCVVSCPGLCLVTETRLCLWIH